MNRQKLTTFAGRVIFAALCFAVLSATSEASDYRVEIDCNHSNVSNSDTGDRISVEFLDPGGRIVGTKYTNGVRNCLVAEAVFTLSVFVDVSSIVVRTSGNDAFYIDELRFYKDGQLIKHEGRDNGRGWCLSTDSKDSEGAWKDYVSGGCSASVRFVIVERRPAPPPPSAYQYVLEVDCKHSSLSNTHTANRIIVYLFDESGKWVGDARREGMPGCLGGNTQITINAEKPAAKVQITTNGDDAFFIDRWMLYLNNALINQEGDDDGRGWCLSTNTADTSGSWAGNLIGSCQWAHTFSLGVPASSVTAGGNEPASSSGGSPPSGNPNGSRPKVFDKGFTNIDASATAAQFGVRGWNRYIANFACSRNLGVGPVWGTKVYTDNSSICTAAVHAGLITRSEGGVVTIFVTEGKGVYFGSRLNGILTMNGDAFPGSFFFVYSTPDGKVMAVEPKARETAAQPGETAAQPAPPAFEPLPPSPRPKPPARTNVGPIGWDATVVSLGLRGRGEKRYTFQCSANGALGSVKGTILYTDDSSICSAAVHAGAIKREEGGSVTVVIQPGQSSYQGSVRNGITSGSSGPFGGTFEFVSG
ncbi:MAG: hypothetical protein IPM63_13955 [Acidobacteriota bacterium]|nr:MAG: hypothetical protein IPM63_13955 [Acidobacteriota bacterium]